MSILEKYSLKEICDFQNGFAFKNEDYIEKNDDALEVFRMGYINKGGGYKDDSSPVFIPKSYPKNLEKYLLLEGDIAMAMTDMKNSMAILGYSARIPTSNRFVLNQRVGRIRVIKKDLVDEKYLYYFMNSKEYILSLQSKSNSGVQVNLGTNAIKDSIIFLPSLQRQKYVSDILYTLDEKIALNTQINQTLEQIAQTIFKSWFIDFDPVHAKANALASGQTAEQATQAAMAVISGKNTQELHRLQTANLEQYQQLWEIAEAFPSGVDEEGVPRGWEERYLKDVCNIVYGKNLPTSELKEQGYPVFGGNGVIGFYDKYLYEKPHTLVSCRGAASGKVIYSLPNSFVTNNSLVIEHSKSYLSSFYVYEALSIQNLTELTSGSAQPQMTIANMNPVQIMVPTEIVHSLYVDFVKDIYDKKLCRLYENEILSKIRDELLPKLLSGEV
ncbi:restriction endonuclease subunit S [Glaesserella parasuis]|nr:restriction endonuclease subunit S [Glaesserella parasuis]